VVSLSETVKDVSEYLEKGMGTGASLKALAAAASEWQPAKSEGITPDQDTVMQQLETMTLRQILSMDFPEPEWVVPGLIPQGQVSIIAGKAKIGKSCTCRRRGWDGLWYDQMRPRRGPIPRVGGY
jgi:hypothetical protein